MGGRRIYGILLRRNNPSSTIRFCNARQHPQLTTQVKLFYNGQEVFTGKEAPFVAQQTSSTKRLFAGGAIDLGANLKPGEYLLQVIVNDLLAKEKQRTVTQWMNFDIVN